MCYNQGQKNMKKKVLISILATLTSNIIKRKFLCYTCLNPCYEAWIGSNLFSVATTICFTSLALPPTNEDGIPTLILFIYYTATYLLVSLLALQLIWVPVVDAVSELNTILSKTVSSGDMGLELCVTISRAINVIIKKALFQLLYINKNLCTRAKNSLVKQVGLFLGTKTATIWSANLLAMLFLYAASMDILKFIAMYFYCMPKRGIFAIVRSKALRFINALLYMTGSRKCVGFQWIPKRKQYLIKSNSFTDRHGY